MDKQEDTGVARSAAGRSAALRAEPVPVSGLRPAATNAEEIARDLDQLAAETASWLPTRAADLIRQQNEAIERIRGIDYWDGSGNDLLDWVTLGYVERGDGRREINRRCKPLCDSGSRSQSRAAFASRAEGRQSGDAEGSASPQVLNRKA